ncbi:MAG: hypothetical protein PHN49_05860 [Candidatus Omnitrophica bacterium]|nr:hypothetical protein [Candidatus Omnitrophota bacterium]
MRKIPVPPVLLIASTLLTVVSVSRVLWAQWLLSRAAYYVLFLLVIVWLIVLIHALRVLKPDLRRFFGNYGSGILFSVFLAGVIFISAQPYFRVQTDESKILNVSRSMFLEHKTDNVSEGIQLSDGTYLPLFRNFPQRCLLFQFLTSLIHQGIGYRPWNPFILNFIVLSALLSVIFIFCRRHFGPTAGFVAVLLVVSQPIFSLSASSGGLDLLSALFTFISLMALEMFLNKPTPFYFNLLWMQLLMLAHTREETILFAVVMMLFLMVYRYFKFEWVKSSWVLGMTPVLLWPIVWQRVAITHAYLFEDPPGGIAFSPVHFIHHLGVLLATALRFDFRIPYASAINLIGIGALFYFMFLFVLKRWPKGTAGRHWVAMVTVSLALRLAVLCSYYFANPLNYLASRFYIVFLVLLSILIVAFLHRKGILQRSPRGCVLAALLIFVPYHAVTVSDENMGSLYLNQEFRCVMDFMKEKSPKETLLILDSPDMYSGRHLSVVNFDYANENRKKLAELLNYTQIHEIYVFQRFLPASRQIDGAAQLDPGYQVTFIKYIAVSPGIWLRLSKLSSIDRTVAV